MKHCDWGLFALHMGDCREVLRQYADATFDSVVCDPPYGLTANKKGGTGTASIDLETPYGRARIGVGNGPGGFMGMKWDSGVPPAATWAEVLRVLKPGGHMVAFFGTRTYHRGVVAVEDAGFEIRDQIGWAFGSGFPKSHNGPWGGTALKPAWEPIVLARKPLIGTVEANHATHGTGALNIDGCRVGDFQNTTPSGVDRRNAALADAGYRPGAYQMGEKAPNTPPGRWPANLIHDGSDEVLAAFPLAAGQLADASTTAPSEKTAGIYGAMRRERGDEPSANSENAGTVGFKMRPGARRLDSGSAARFFYAAKASKSDRDAGCEGLAVRQAGIGDERPSGSSWERRAPEKNPNHSRANTHPTVKPTDLMRYLCRLITPAGGLVLDPFCGSGSTGKAAMLEGMRFVGVDLSAEYLTIAERRIAHAAFGDAAFGVRA